MDKEQRKRMAYRFFVQQDEEQPDIQYTIEVSGDRVELHQYYEMPWEGEDGEAEQQHSCWVMSKDTLKKFIHDANWCIEKSEAFEASHPVGQQNS